MSASDLIGGPLTLEEMIKLVSLLENPPEGATVRKALRFYDVPKRLRDPLSYRWANSVHLITLLLHYAYPQAEEELNWMMKRLDGARSLLEVGSNFGGSLKHMASKLTCGSRIVSVDLPVDETPTFLNPLASLRETCRQIGELGADMHLIIGDSHNPAVVEAVRNLGPFDFAFIDGDHSYEGVKADWASYGPMSKVVAFHDVAGAVEGCARFWAELKQEGKYRTEEFVATDSAHCFGIGIVYRE